MTLIWSCSSSKPQITENKMADIIADLTLAEAYAHRPYKSLLNDSDRRLLRQSILQKYNVTPQEFDSTLMWYGHHMDKYSELYEKVDKRLDKRAQTISPNTQTDINSKSLWPLPDMITISPKSLADGCSFTIPGTDVSPGQTIEWSMRINRLLVNATAVIIADYGNHKYSIARTSIRESGKLRLQLTTNPTQGSPQRITGYLHLSDTPPMQVWVDSISLTTQDSGSDMHQPSYDTRSR